MNNPRTEAVIARFNALKEARYNWESQWRDIRELVRTTTETPGQTDTPGDRRNDKIFDGTAPWALEQLAAGLNSFLTSPTDRWFNIGIANQNEEMSDEELLWCETVSDMIYREYADPEVNLNPMLHECYMDLGGFGTAIIYQDYDWEAGHVFFKSFPLADCYLAENSKGRVDTVARKSMMSTRQVLQEFKKNRDRVPAKISTCEDMEKKWTIIHLVQPRSDKDQIPKTFKFASSWVCCEFKDEPPLREAGYNDFPYHVPRWSKMSGEIYGRSPAMACLPDIKMINTMSKVVIVAGQKIIDPPLIVPDDGFMLPLKTSPGSLIFKTAGQEDTIQPLQTGGRVDIGLDMMEQRRQQIVRAFYVDWIIRQKKRERQTATEVVDDRNEMLRQMSPMLGRTQVELHNPMLVRTYNLMDAAGKIPLAPESLRTKELRLYYVSPAAVAQFGSKANNITAFINEIVQYAAVDPTIIDIVNPDEMASQLAKLRDVSRKVLRTSQQLQDLRQSRQQQQQLQAGAEAAKNLGAATKSFAQAKQVEAELV